MNPDIPDLRLGLENMLDDRDYLFRLLNTIDWEAQLEAVRAVLARNRAASDRVSANIAVLDEHARSYTGPYHDHVVDEHVDAMYRSTYSDAVVSLSAIGMVVPMMESIFSQSLLSLGAMYAAKGMSPPEHPRWQRAGSDQECWNCQWYFGRRGPRNDIISGIPQLSEAVGLSTYLQSDMLDWIAAMLSYRNRMFHGGFEWSVEQRDQFEDLIAARQWEKYFQSARTNDKPWIFICVTRSSMTCPNAWARSSTASASSQNTCLSSLSPLDPSRVSFSIRRLRLRHLRGSGVPFGPGAWLPLKPAARVFTLRVSIPDAARGHGGPTVPTLRVGPLRSES